MNKKKNKKIAILSFLLFVFFIQINFSYAQTADQLDQLSQLSQSAESLTRQNTVRASITPKYPKPNSEVSISLNDYTTDLNRANISWYLNNSLIKDGIGEKFFSFITQDIGVTSVVEVVINTNDRGVINKLMRITPTETDIVWEADTYIPPFYKGKRLFTRGSNIRLIALPNIIDSNGIKANSGELLYRWKKNGTVLSNDSGYGKRVLNLDSGDFYRNPKIEVEVETLDGKVKSRGITYIQTSRPKILLYESSPLSGINFSKVLSGDIILESGEVTVEAYPYFFAFKNKLNNEVEYSWKMEGKKIDVDEDNPDKLVLQKGEGSGKVSISLKIQNLDSILQYANSAISVLFGVKDDSLFSL